MKYFLVITWVILWSVGAYATMELTLMSEAAEKEGAVCLDGSPGGYYFREGQVKNKFTLFTQGGGWCYTESDCVKRSTGSLGSSNGWASARTGVALLSADKNINPTFHQWSASYLAYCDGASYSGNVKNPVNINNSTIYYRGHRIFRAWINDLIENHGLGQGDGAEVIFNGCSAGGLAVFLHCDEVAEMLPNAKVRCLPGSGYFLESANVAGKNVYPDNMKRVFNFQNCTGGVNQGCIAANQADPSQCMFAQHTFPHVKTPTLILNSFDDSWQLGNVLQLPSSCVSRAPSSCTQAEINNDMDPFANEIIGNITQSPNYGKPHYGAFLWSCCSHCAESGNHGWTTVTVGDLTIRQAVTQWYQHGNVRINDCILSTNANCNPTC